MADLSILIPSRNEMFLKKTIEDILSNIEGNTEIIAVLDGQWADPPIPDHPKVTLIYYAQSIGQRAAINRAAKLSKAKYLMKVDAHCAFDKGFDMKMMQEMHDNWTLVPTMRNLHAFDWVCKCGHRRYQSPTPVNCPNCDNTTEFERDIVWTAKDNPQSISYCFDSEPHFQYFKEFSKRPEGQGEITPTMSLQGSCFMLTRDKFFELNVCDEENFGSWGSQGIEVSAKTWLSGGQVMVNKKTWYAHMFRTQGGDFSFPYSLSGNQVSKAKSYAKNLFFENKWEKQIYPLSWLLEKFWPVPGWSDEAFEEQKKIGKNFQKLNSDLVDENKKVEKIPQNFYINKSYQKGILFYTDNQLEVKIAHKVQKQLNKIGLPITSVSLKPMPHFGNNIYLKLKRGYLTMFKQILAGLESMHDIDIIYFAEHDVLYHPSHFELLPEKESFFYYNQNVWNLDRHTGQALFYYANRTSGLFAFRSLLLEHYQKRVELIEKNGFTRKMGFEPGTHNRPERVDDYGHIPLMSEFPNIDIRHDSNLTTSRWSQDQFRNKKFCRGWQMADEIPGWKKISF